MELTSQTRSSVVESVVKELMLKPSWDESNMSWLLSRRQDSPDTFYLYRTFCGFVVTEISPQDPDADQYAVVRLRTSLESQMLTLCDSTFRSSDFSISSVSRSQTSILISVSLDAEKLSNISETLMDLTALLRSSPSPLWQPRVSSQMCAGCSTLTRFCTEYELMKRECVYQRRSQRARGQTKQHCPSSWSLMRGGLSL